MTKEQINKHRDVIIWFATGDNTDKGVWHKSVFRKDYNTDNWHRCKQPEFNYYDIYVQNDEYAELRKAQADGKIIQEQTGFNQKADAIWEDLDKVIDACKTMYGYRIKPKEPKFKKGDWVRVHYDRNDGFERIGRHKEINNNIFYSLDVLLVHHYEELKADITLELWTPTEDEMCIFWNDKSLTNKCYVISQYREQLSKIYDNVAPLEFAQTLKEK